MPHMDREEAINPQTLYDLEAKVVEFMHEQPAEGEASLWSALVDSARKLEGGGCDGILLAKAEKRAESLLSGMDVAQLRRVWRQTENGMLSVEQGFDDPQTCEMVHDIVLDVQEGIAYEVCREAEESKAARSRTRRKA